MRKLAALAALCAALGASPPPQTSGTYGDTRCPRATQAIAKYDALVENPATLVTDAVAAALDVSATYDQCTAFSAARDYAEDVHYGQVRSAQYHYAAGRLYFLSEEYALAREQLDIARLLVQDTIDWVRPDVASKPGTSKGSSYRDAAVAVRDAAAAMLAKIPVPTGVSTAPAVTPATPSTPAPK